MRTKTPALALFLGLVLCLCATGNAQSQQQQQEQQSEELNIRAYVELLRSNLRDNRRNVIAAVMQFSNEDAVKFWPIYAQYEKELDKLGDMRVKLIEDYVANYNNMTDATADNLVNRSLEFEARRTALKRKYYAKFKAALSAYTAGRFYQVENQLQMLTDLQIAARLPIVSKAQGSAQEEGK